VLDRPVGGFCPTRRSRVKRDRKRASSIVNPALYWLGSINADFQARIDRAPDTGRTLIGKDFLRLSGGKAAKAFRIETLGQSFRVPVVFSAILAMLALVMHFAKPILKSSSLLNLDR
jgi:hypothetical protein